MFNNKTIPFKKDWMKKIILYTILATITGCSKQQVKHNYRYDFEALRNKLGLDSSYVPVEYKNDYSGIKALFFIAEGQDTFHYAIQENDSIFLWAIVKKDKVKIIRDL